MKWRHEEDLRLRALTHVGEGRDRRQVVWIVSAGEAMDQWAHHHIWRMRSAAEQCALHGDSRFWNRGQQET